MVDIAKFRDNQISKVDGIITIGGVTKSLIAMVSDNLELKDNLAAANELLKERPRDATLAALFCKWLNEHDQRGGWQICLCDLCKETKAHLDKLGDPCIHTTMGWAPIDGKEEFKTRDVAPEMMDSPRLTIDVGNQICEG